MPRIARQTAATTVASALAFIHLSSRSMAMSNLASFLGLSGLSTPAQLVVGYMAPVICAGGILLVFTPPLPGATWPLWKQGLLLAFGLAFSTSFMWLREVARLTPHPLLHWTAALCEWCALMAVIILYMHRKVSLRPKRTNSHDRPDR